MKFKCSQCDYSSDIKQSIAKHINKKIKCQIIIRFQKLLN